ncbi:MAG: HAMP domain-containing sensor histidine kinase [Methylovulum sp.]|uniref:sensor histidine kinase n=1 Tax=Methylovulum sp. TaxID=1916980 RepID=UPI002632971D|nr:HAMP domain-containing sensor histidine kinase [Methylovulum sp.]MDD2725123.1 HAMP domain-containing sensor histidine kinase [Methylovulum sp.]MDD5126358.1 HAMP domain-containing sensor histidine kinase [Methylovulum sp.]
MTFKNLLSLKSLIILGFVIAVIPLFLAVIYAALGLRETSALGRIINTQVFEQTKVVRLVLQKTADIERKARLFVLLSDPAVRQPYERQSYESTRAAFKQALGELLKLRVDNKIALLVNELSEKETLIYQQIISSTSGTNSSVAIDEAFQGLRDSSHNLSREFENHVDHEFNALHQQSETLEEGLLVKGAVLLSVSFGVIVTLLLVISRSLRQLDSSIRRLGSGELAETIVVAGPSDLRYLGNRLEWLRSHLLELEVSKQQFIHNVAREIEQPLASIRESAEMLITNADADNPQQEIAQRLSNTVDKLKTVSDELIRYSQINTKPDSIRKGNVNMKALLESVLEDFQPRLQDKNLSVKKLVRPVEIDGVAEQLRSIIEQLLANAVKYSPTGGEIRIMLRDSGQQMELEVEDEGQGVAPEDREHVFEPFFRGETVNADDAGPGLGLAIVREYVANHQGKAEIIDPREDQQGARFRVQIPLTGDA